MTATAPLLSARGPARHLPRPARRGPARAPSTASTSTSGPARSSRWSASPGCGKTTLARSLLGLVPPDGRARSPSTASRSTTPAARSRRTASGSSWSSRTPAARSTRGTRCTTRWPRACASTGTPATSGPRWRRPCRGPGCGPPERFFLRYPHELSGGQRQRVVIAGALALEPELIVADEPVASLDASVRGEILALLLRLRDELGLSALVVTHDLGLAWNIADRVAVMYLGRIVETGEVEEVLTAPQHPYTQALLSVLPEAAGRSGGPHGRAAGPVPHPVRLPLPRALPDPGVGRGGAGGGRGRVPWRGPAGARRGRGGAGGVPLGTAPVTQ